ncbi:MAG: isopeptide-forming domain-containing fimbrial protein [Erysipelotrichaceae bacterium]|nr:isopeptide-forming domain-containing fimbrial protein [Erysipelotrichaceae bacterium]
METILNKTKFHKVFAILMAMFFALSFSLTGVHAQITDSDKVKVNVEVAEGDEVAIYKIIDVKYNFDADQPQEPMYTWDSNVAGWIKDNYSAKNYVATDSNAVTSEFSKKEDPETFKEFLQKLAAALKTNKIQNVEPTVPTNGLASLGMGEYLIVGTNANTNTPKFYLPTTIVVVPEYDEDQKAWKLVAKADDKVLTPDQDTYKVNLKSTTLEFTKSINATGETFKNMKTVGVGDKVDYLLTAMVPVYPADAVNKTFTIEDNAGDGLTIKGDSVKVYSDKDSANPLTQGVDTKVEGQKITITFTYDTLVQNNVTNVYVKYSATVNGKAPETDALKNTATLTFARDPYTVGDNGEITSKQTVYTYAMDITKVGDGDLNKGLTGAEFTLKKNGGAELSFVDNKDGSYTLAAENEQSEKTTKLAVDTNGHLVLKGLDTGEYVLTETKAANGMVLPNNPEITVTLVDGKTGDPNGELDTGETTVESSIVPTDDTNKPSITGNTLKFKVVNSNKANFELPNTGGAGTLMFTVGGILLMAGAVIYLIITRKKA